MTTELWTLVAAAALQWLLIVAAAGPNILIKGLAWAAGNREEQGEETPPWVHRLKRASDNLHENLILFAIGVLVVHVAGESDGTSSTGAMVFIGARVAHALIYVAGIPYLRTLSWLVGVVGTVMVYAALAS